MTEEEKFVYKLALPIVRDETLADHVQTLYENTMRPESRSILSPWIALEDFYYIDQDLVVLKGTQFNWLIYDSHGSLRIQIL